MGKHRKSRRRSATPAVVAGATAGLSTVLAFGQAASATAVTIPAADTVVGVGGWQNPTGDRIPDKFLGRLVPEGQAFTGVQYPAELPVDPSVAAGQQPLRDAITAARADGTVLVVGYSEGSLVAEAVKRQLVAAGSPDTADVAFMFIAAPFVPNGGVYSRFPGLRLPGFTSTGAAEPSPYAETFVTLEYDLIGDFPAYANPLSLANAVAGLVYVHGDQGPDNVDLETAPQSVLEVGDDTYVLIRAEHLPLLQPVRDVSAAVGATRITEPFVSAAEPTLRVLVDAGYTSRDHRHIDEDPDADYQDADEATPFRLITPPSRVVASAAALPDAVRDGATNFVSALRPDDAETPAPKVSPKKATTKITAVRNTDAEDADAKDADDKPATKRTVRRGPVAKAVSKALDRMKPAKKNDSDVRAKKAADKSDDKPAKTG